MGSASGPSGGPLRVATAGLLECPTPDAERVRVPIKRVGPPQPAAAHNNRKDYFPLKPGIDARLDLLVRAGQQPLLRHGLKGLEKESLRLAADGLLAQTPHPPALGSALTHASITTDYSEALIELITPPFREAAETLRYLEDLHAFVYSHLGDEFLLATSMPCGITGDESIPIARYGTSNVGRMKHVYRHGLAWRYGRAMQAIAGVHFNYSVNEALWPILRELTGNRDPLARFVADAYFGVIRNVHRHGWLLIYLFGMSPVVCKGFFGNRDALAATFPEIDTETRHRPYATSLRMSDIGYRNANQAGLDISLDNLDDYVASLSQAIAMPHPDYERIGVQVDGEYRQLNANILQIENEYYTSIRPKQIAESGEKPTLALKRRGVRYLELRVLDLNGFHPAGASLDELYFLETFMLYCFLADSPPLAAAEKAETGRNSLAVACCGRTPGFTLHRGDRAVGLREWATEILDGMAAIAEILDGDDPERPYTLSLERQRLAVREPDATPSARMLAEMRRSGECFRAYALRLSREHAEYFRARRLAEARAEAFRREAEESLEEQRRIEAADRIGFDEFLQRYFSQS
jgi:glutamate--cysteine ligase